MRKLSSKYDIYQQKISNTYLLLKHFLKFQMIAQVRMHKVIKPTLLYGLNKKLLVVVFV